MSNELIRLNFLKKVTSSNPVSQTSTEKTVATSNESESVFENNPQTTYENYINSDDSWKEIQAKEDKTFGLWSSGKYSYTSVSGVTVTLEDTQDVHILENKETGEVVVIGAKGAQIKGGDNGSSITIYDSEIDSIKTGKNDDDIKIYNSKIDKLNTKQGSDSVIIENSEINDIDLGDGEDFISISDSEIEDIKTNSGFLWGVFDDSQDSVYIENTNVDELETGKGDNKTVLNNSNVKDISEKNNTVVKDGNYLDFDINEISSIKSDKTIELQDGSSITVEDYVNYMINQEVGFETVEEYQAYAIDSLKANLDAMEELFLSQEDNDGIVADGYNFLKELTGMGISDEDIRDILQKQEKIINELEAAANGESDMSFEEAYKYYMGVEFSTEKIDNHLKIANAYYAVVNASSYDEDYIEKFEEKTGQSFEELANAYGLSQFEAYGKDTFLNELVNNYGIDQETFANKLSGAISTIGISCMAIGGVISFVFPPAGIALMTAGKYISLSGMFIDNAIDLIDDTTDKNGLTWDEFSENATETVVEVVTYKAGQAIGKFTSSLNNKVTNKLVQNGMNNIGAKFVGEAAELTTDTALSLASDFAIAQGESLVTTGQFMDGGDYWSLDRFLGEGKNQLMGILTGIGSGKIEAYQKTTIETAQSKILDGDIEGAKAYMQSRGMKIDDTSFSDFEKQVYEANNLKIASEQGDTEAKAKLDEVKAQVETENIEAPKAEAEAEAPKAEIEAEAPKAEVEAEAPKAEIEAEAPKAEVEAEASKAEVEAEAPKADNNSQTQSNNILSKAKETAQEVGKKASEAASSAVNKAKNTAEKIATSETTQKAKETAQEVGKKASEAASSAVNKTKNLFNRAKATISSGINKLSSKTSQTLDTEAETEAPKTEAQTEIKPETKVIETDAQRLQRIASASMVTIKDNPQEMSVAEKDIRAGQVPDWQDEYCQIRQIGPYAKQYGQSSYVGDLNDIAKSLYSNLSGDSNYRIKKQTGLSIDNFSFKVLDDTQKGITDMSNIVTINNSRGWLYRSSIDCQYADIRGADCTERLSINCKASADLINALDRFVTNGTYVNSKSETVKVEGANLLNYKTPNVLQNWNSRQDPITFYCYNKDGISQEIYTAIAEITAKYARDTIRNGNTDYPWMSNIEGNITNQEVYELIYNLQKYTKNNPRYDEFMKEAEINLNPQSNQKYAHTSIGIYEAFKNILGYFEKYYGKR